MHVFWVIPINIVKHSKWLGIFLLFCSTFICAANTDGELPGLFVINANGDVVCFSQGNLTYTQSTKTWSFADHQYDIIGNDNLVDDELADRIDLFGWSGDSESAKHNYGVTTSGNTLEYNGNFLDWGNNPISNGGNKANLWRTLTDEEWTYLLANNNQFPTKVNGVPGIAVMPYTVHVNKPASYTLDEWAEAEKQGLIFLPFTGYRASKDTSVRDITTYGYYWTATALQSDPMSAKIMRCNTSKAMVLTATRSRSQGSAVRLVKNKTVCTVLITVNADPQAGSVSIEVIE